MSNRDMFISQWNSDSDIVKAYQSLGSIGVVEFYLVDNRYLAPLSRPQVNISFVRKVKSILLKLNIAGEPNFTNRNTTLAGVWIDGNNTLTDRFIA